MKKLPKEAKLSRNHSFGRLGKKTISYFSAFLLIVLGFCFFPKPLRTQEREKPPGPATGLSAWRSLGGGMEWMDLVGSAIGAGQGGSPTELKAFRVRYPPGFENDKGSHYHFWTEHIIILRGTLVLGFGEHPDPSKVKEYGPGSFLVIPVGAPHFERLRGEVEAHVEAIGRGTTVWLNHSKGYPKTNSREVGR